MKAWELALKTRKAGCEALLAFARDRHGDIAVERARSPEGGDAWKAKSHKMAIWRWQIRKELDEIEFIKKLANVGPIVGNKMVLHVRDGTTHKVRPGPSIIDLMNREANKYDLLGDNWVPTEEEISTQFHAKSVAEGIAIALRILSNPYLYLDRDERVAYERAEEDEAKIIKKRAGEPTPADLIMPGANTAPTLAQAKRDGVQVVRRRAQ